MLRRRRADDIRIWLKDRSDKRALMLTGARQTGKTFLIRQVLKEEKVPFIEINFIEHPEYKEAFLNVTGAGDIIARLSLAAGKALEKKRTVFFLDEVQECPELVTQIKFLVDETNYRFILSGSLLGVELKGIRSIPVGYLKTIHLFPLDIGEFFLNIGVRKETLDTLRISFEKQEPVDSFVHGQLMKIFSLYLVVGGMPAAVQTYIDTNDLSRVEDIQKNIIEQYRLDFSKYQPSTRPELWDIYDAIPSELEQKNRRFIVSHVAGKVNFDRVRNKFLWLKDAGTVLPVYNVTEPIAPLSISEKRNLFKLFMSDVGLLSSHFSPEIRLQILNQSLKINEGGIYENIAAQELYSHGYDLYYYNTKPAGEVDFLLEKDARVVPIEIKSGADYAAHHALDHLMASYSIPQAYVFCTGNVTSDGRALYLPIYMLGFLRKQENDSLLYAVDLTGL